MQRFHSAIRDDIDHQFTVYGREQADADNPPEWALCPAGGEVVHTVIDNWEGDLGWYYTGVTHHVIVDVDGKVFIGESVCSKKDQFRKKTGHLIAMGRAEEAMYCYYKVQLYEGGVPVTVRIVTMENGEKIVKDVTRWLESDTVITMSGTKIDGLVLVKDIEYVER